ncbi:BamA/TamA family outer membrane protein [Algoriphagus aestuarii]|nr:BamA/TamA family outer membrane protein [Algoriphagus aestuarii]
MRKYCHVLLFLALIAANQSLGQTGIWMKWESAEEEIQQDWKSYPDQMEIERDLDSVLTDFYQRGYISAFWDKTKEVNDSLTYLLHLGTKFELSEIRKGNISLGLMEDLPPPVRGFMEWNLWISNALDYFENRGFPFAQIKLDSISRESKLILAAIHVDQGPFISWDSLRVGGSTKTQARYLQNLTRIKPGSAFSQKEFEDASEILDRSPYFELSQGPDLTFRIKSASPTFYLRDRNVNLIDGLIGLLPNENEPGKVLITGQLDLELYHLGGKGRDVAVHWQRMNKETQSLDLHAKESFLFGSPLSIRLGFHLLKQDSSFLNRHFSMDFGYDFSKNSSIRFFTKRQASDLISTYAYREVDELPEIADSRWNLYGVGLTINKLDSPFFPRRGFYLLSEFAAGNKKIIQNTGIPESVYQDLDLNTPQITGSIQVEEHVWMSPSWGMWFRGSGGFIKNENLLLNDLFRIGGLKSIRGFNENYFFAKNYGYMNMEQRLFFGGNSYLMIFTDFGLLQNPYDEKENDYPVSFGTGINLETGNGVFRFIYGLGKSNLQPLSFSYSRIHFGYLARF